ncbi:MmpS family transport accessory protein [Streptomyces sp. NPDC101132]|uniref:MmpS family transport accessory protein n=1 Tax=Streptomyces sp. NPDC101132 TaxID=3366110 RepID=UPI0037F6CDC5
MLSSRSARTALVAAVLLAGVTACSASEATSQVDKAIDKAVDETYEVTYEVTGKGVEHIEFAAGGGTATAPKMETVKGVALPWKKTVTLRGIMPASVMPVAADVTGAEVACKITHKGKVIAEQTAQGLATAGACVAVSPIAN